jgi:ATP-dependent Clp endopeptidase proteolytic subunit ClpP
MTTLNFKKKKDYELKVTEKKDEDSENKKKKVKNDVWNGNTDFPSVEIYKNHIYFYCGVTKKTCLKLNNELRKLEYNILNNGQNILNKDKFIYIHINSFGGSVFAALSTIDTIQSLRVPIVSIIEGSAASAATMISICCNYRIILPNSLMLIHQLSSSTWGKMNELEDEMKNLKKLMKMITELYKKYTKLKPNKLDEILKHDIWWDSKECLKVGLVDEIFKNQQVYEFDRKKLDL